MLDIDNIMIIKNKKSLLRRMSQVVANINISAKLNEGLILKIWNYWSKRKEEKRLGEFVAVNILLERNINVLEKQRIIDVNSSIDFVSNNVVEKGLDFYKQLLEVNKQKKDKYIEDLIRQNNSNNTVVRYFLKKVNEMKKIKYFSLFLSSSLFMLVMFLMKYVQGLRYVKESWFISTSVLNLSKIGNMILDSCIIKYYFVGKAVKKLIYKPFMFPIFNFFSRICGRVFGVWVYINVESMQDVNYLYTTVNGQHMILTKESNEVLLNILSSKVDLDTKLTLIDKVFQTSGKEITFMEKIVSFFNGKLIKVDFNKLTILDNFDNDNDDFHEPWWNNDKVPDELLDVKLPDMNGLEVNAEIDLSVLTDNPVIQENVGSNNIYLYLFIGLVVIVAAYCGYRLFNNWSVNHPESHMGEEMNLEDVNKPLEVQYANEVKVIEKEYPVQYANEVKVNKPLEVQYANEVKVIEKEYMVQYANEVKVIEKEYPVLNDNEIKVNQWYDEPFDDELYNQEMKVETTYPSITKMLAARDKFKERANYYRKTASWAVREIKNSVKDKNIEDVLDDE